MTNEACDHDRLEDQEADSVAVADVMEGRRSYDSLNDASQAVVRDQWDLLIGERIANLDLVSKFRAEGQSWVTADANGVVTIHRP